MCLVYVACFRIGVYYRVIHLHLDEAIGKVSVFLQEFVYFRFSRWYTRKRDIVVISFSVLTHIFGFF